MSDGRPLLVTPGMGIGPEITLRALEVTDTNKVVLIGREGPLREVHSSIHLVGVNSWAMALSALEEGVAVPIWEPSNGAEPVEVAAIRIATERCMAKEASGLVTGPIHKARLAAQGFQFRGHTDFLGDLCGVRPVMGFVGGELRVALVTTHIPLSAVPEAVSRERVVHTVRTADRALREYLGLGHPRIVVCGLNPHAGENGLLGTEDRDAIVPAIAELIALGLDVRGPLGVEAAFLAARSGQADLVVAMYHDQGLGPLKAVDFGRSVNWSMGLPIVRVSVDHGTADDLVGTGRAKPDSMIAALNLARTIVQRQGVGL